MDGSRTSPRVSRSAFTLIEMMIVVGIFLVMLGVTLASFRQAIPQRELTETARRFASDIEQMRVASYAGDPQHPDAISFGVVLDGALVDRYERFRSTQAQFDPDAPPEIIEGITLPDNVFIRSLTPTSGSEQILSISYTAPRGALTITNDATEAEVVFGHTGTSETRTVRVNGISGRVDLE
ncbi:MAG: type II secretion system protein [bacterium]|nr:type II secretion system protein [bacterium]